METARGRRSGQAGGDPAAAAVKRAVVAVRALAGVPGGLLVVCDFDGTLTPISPDPTAPAILPAARRALRRLARAARRRPDRLALAILSGRTALDVAARVRVGGLTYLGDHGIQGGDLPWAPRPSGSGWPTTRISPGTTPSRGAWATRWGDASATPRGSTWSPRDPSVAFHFRAADDAPAARAPILAALDDATASLPLGLRGPRFQRWEGRRIVELRPQEAGAKGEAVARLLRRHGSTAALVIGDDRSDAEAFAVVAREREAGRLAACLLLGVRGPRDCKVVPVLFHKRGHCFNIIVRSLQGVFSEIRRNAEGIRFSKSSGT